MRRRRMRVDFATAAPLAFAAVMAAGVGLCAAALSSASTRFVPAVSVPWLVIAAAFVVAELFPFDVPAGEQTVTINISEVVFTFALFALAPLGLLAVRAATVTLSSCIRRPSSAAKLVFNVAQTTLAAALGLVVFHAIVPTLDLQSRQVWIAAVLAATIAAAMSMGAITAVIMTVEHAPGIGRSLLRGSAFDIGGAPICGTLGVLAAIVVSVSPDAAVLLIGPLAAVVLAYRACVAERAQSTRVHLLHSSSEIMRTSADLHSGLMDLLEQTRGALHAEAAELLLAGGDGEYVAYTAASVRGQVRNGIAPADPARSRTLFAAVDPNGPVACKTLPLRGWAAATIDSGPALVAPISNGTDLCGVLAVTRTRRTAPRFTRADRRTIEAVTSVLATAVQHAHVHASVQGLEHRTLHDALTGLANRTAFEARLTEALQRPGAARAAVLYIDLDNFKDVNDTHGHAAGDQVLVRAGERLRNCVRAGDTVARLAGDEFAAILAGITHADDVDRVIGAIENQFAQPVEVDGRPVVVRASVGIAIQSGPVEATELMRRADAAMYKAKRSGKARRLKPAATHRS